MFQYLTHNNINRKSLTLVFLFFLSFYQANSQLSPLLIKFYKGNNNIFPSEWRSDKIQVKATIPHSDLSSALDELGKALGKYPKKFDSTLKNIFLLGNFYYQGHRYPAAHSDENIYIGIRHNNDIEKIFHREYFEILLKKHPDILNRIEWKNINTGLLYRPETYNTTNAFSAQQLNPLLFEEGFLTNYSLTGWENDVAIYAENLFAGGRTFWMVVDKYPLIKQKAQLVIHFYHQLYPVYTENWFRFIADYRLF